jgi:ATP adenylyltransferase/5',5'''-P-1,P-4-tetraphosphate phosphorylase II
MKEEYWSNSLDACRLLSRQREVWPKLAVNNLALEQLETKEIRIDELRFKVQFNPARIVSSDARIDAQSLRERSCFLCPAHLPAEQEVLPMGNNYVLLCNPYPIFPEHFTIASRSHLPQSIRHSFADFLKIARQLSAFTLFYNGPQSGASAPDHLHFQAVTRSYMPIDDEIDIYKRDCLLEQEGARLYLLTRYLRNGFILEAETEEGVCSLFERLYRTLRHCVEGDSEPRMNIFGLYTGNSWQVIIIPRVKHRPGQYYAEGDERVVTSPGAADIGGIFITARKEDFEKMTPELLQDIYIQINFNDDRVSVFSKYLLNHE